MSRKPGSIAFLRPELPVLKTIPALTTVLDIAARVTAREATHDLDVSAGLAQLCHRSG